ncbi:hypothetical protein F53441_5821 [Fusarium austroafricanum]|uniref:Uncharacterized protein n=1 Tax=Fusarium austroafricanum TaxID=2364996 RepID=A0A8H4KIT2_9HYPO|nr:hypothetical protein F53441_5821 [Fusarium austroafricanum]
MASFTYGYNQVPRHQPQHTMETINPALLTYQVFNAPSYSDRHSTPIIAAGFAGRTQENVPSPSPYSNTGRQELWMGSVGFTDRFTRSSMGYGRTTPNIPLTYELEPLEPLFSRTVHLQQLPPPTVQQNQTCQARAADRSGGDVQWLRGQPQSGYVESTVKIIHNGKERFVKQRVYIHRSYRENATRIRA